MFSLTVDTWSCLFLEKYACCLNNVCVSVMTVNCYVKIMTTPIPTLISSFDISCHFHNYDKVIEGYLAAQTP